MLAVLVLKGLMFVNPHSLGGSQSLLRQFRDAIYFEIAAQICIGTNAY